jgi:hypothetical protein
MSSVDRAPEHTEKVVVMRRPNVQHFVALSTAAAAACRHSRSVLRAWRLDALADTTELLVSELMVNAVETSGSGDVGQAHTRYQTLAPQWVALRLSCTDTSLVIEVWDGDESPPVLAERSREAGGGRGLFFVSRSSRRWAYYWPRTGGKVTWCEIELPGSGYVVEGEPHLPLPRRETPARPATAIEFVDDLGLLQRVADGLRALDPWQTIPRRPP